MKDENVSKFSEMTDQELAEAIFDVNARQTRLLLEAEWRTCANAEKGAEGAADANAYITQALGLSYQTKAAATFAGNSLPDVTVNFGGK